MGSEMCIRDSLGTADWSTKREIICLLVKRIEVAKDVVRVVFRVDPSSPAPSEARQRLPHCPTRRHPASDVERRDRVPLRQGTRPRCGLNQEERAITLRPNGRTGSCPWGTRSKVIALRVQSLWASARKVVRQIEMPCSPDPIMRRPRADREEKRVTRGGGVIRTRMKQE